MGPCECCTKKHDGQQGGVAVSEDKWYGLDEGPFDGKIRHLQNFPPNPLNKKAVENWKNELKDLAKKDQALQERKDMMEEARACGLLPDPPCNIYRVFPLTKEEEQKARDEHEAAPQGCGRDKGNRRESRRGGQDAENGSEKERNRRRVGAKKGQV